MRFVALVLIAALAACASGGGAETPTDPRLAAARGTALPPPAETGAGRAAPPEGQAPGGFDFGQWRGADPAVYAPALQTQVRARYAGQSSAQIRADLEANGFACNDEGRLDCRIEIMERQCAHDWYVVVEPGREPVAGFDLMCLGAR
ncbi:MAG TPA: hypothetical protein PLK37_09220 [Terricaulis sp.]|nr:hypothetical protein [Terricaulis sp.]